MLVFFHLNVPFFINFFGNHAKTFRKYILSYFSLKYFFAHLTFEFILTYLLTLCCNDLPCWNATIYFVALQRFMSYLSKSCHLALIKIRSCYLIKFTQWGLRPTIFSGTPGIYYMYMLMSHNLTGKIFFPASKLDRKNIFSPPRQEKNFFLSSYDSP